MTPQARRSELDLRAPSLVRYLLAAILIPIAIVAMLLWLGRENDRSEKLRIRAAQSYERQIEEVELLSHLKDAETAQRGYLVTSNPAFLAPYEPARREITARLAKARAHSGPEMPIAYVNTVAALAHAKLAELDRTIVAARAGRLEDARKIVASGRGKRLMDRLRDVIGRRIDHEIAQSAERQKAFLAQRAQLQTIVWVVVSLMSVALMAFLAILWRLRWQRYESLIDAFESAERNATILNSTIDAILILNPSGTVEIMNAAATQMLGYSSHELERRDISTIIDLAPGEGSFHKRVGLIDGYLTRSFLADRTVRHRDGREIAADVAIGVMNLPSGTHLVVSLRDISERKRIERVKDDLMSTVSHELRTPLTSIVGSLGLLRSGAAGPIPDGAERLVEIAENNSRRLIRLINDMLDIDRIESGALRLVRDPIDLRLVLDQARVGSEGLANTRNISIASTLPDQPVMASADLDRLLQVITNLLSNAIRAAPEGTTIDLVLATKDISTAVVKVEDRGPGIPTGFRDRIFGRFERAEQDGLSGTGLGLAISREIVTRHDGRIWFEDRPGGGTSFCFSLPVLGSAAALDADAQRVLVCQHDETMASMLCALVVEEGCTYDVAVNVVEARAAIARRNYAALIVDLHLPHTGGMAFAREARDGEPPVNAPILIVAVAGDDARDNPSPLDVIDWIDKRVDSGRLSKALRSALSRTHTKRPIVLHLDDDRDLLEVVSAALSPEAKIVTATNLASARAILQHASPDAVILDIRLAGEVGTDLIPFLVDGDGLAIPTIIYSAQEVTEDLAQQVDAVLVKARGSIPDLKATLRRVVRPRIEQREQP